MNIFISILRFEPGKTLGSEVYLRSLLGALRNRVNDERIFIAANENGVSWGSSIAPEFNWIPIKLPSSIVLKTVLESRVIDDLARKNDADVLFFPFNIMPKVKQPSVLLLHDLVNEFYSKKFPLYKPVYYQTVKRLVRRSIRRADKIITISNSIADELRSSGLLKPGQEVFVAPLASQNISAVKIKPAALNVSKKFILQTGDHLPHKDQITGLKAFSYLAQNHPEAFDSLQLVLTGGSSRNGNLREFVKDNRLENNVTFLGKVSDKELEWLTENSLAVCFPTLYEGFGLGVVEAQLRRKPVIISDIPVLREVSGEQAIFFRPGDAVHLAEKFRQILSEDNAIVEMLDKAKTNAQKLSWDKHSAQVLEAIRQAAKS